MISRKHRKQIKRRQKLETRRKYEERRERAFYDGLDSYQNEYAKLKELRLVKDLLGIFEIDGDQWYDTTTEQKIEQVGLSGHSVIYYTSDYDNEGHRADTEAKATGFASALQDERGKVRPAVFVRDNVFLSDEDGQGDESTADEAKAGIRVLVLLHELGHADDIARGINFNHREKKLDLINAEAYAHKFACDHARKRNYRLALGYYILNLEESLKSEKEYLRLSAHRTFELIDVRSLKEFAARVWSEKGGQQAQIVKRRLQANLQ